ncbi:hypothetical protein ENBRE01_1381 [Enteropsectra breve]|nr:hypothetical protein ENBRE01_1381 [Enteropsectra breve]
MSREEDAPLGKRKASKQLTPHNVDDFDDDEIPQARQEKEIPMENFRKARARRSSGMQIANPDKLRGIFSQGMFSNKNQTQGFQIHDDKMIRLNKSFLKAVNAAIRKQNNKSLSFLFRQYERHAELINENKGRQGTDATAGESNTYAQDKSTGL